LIDPAGIALPCRLCFWSLVAVLWVTFCTWTITDFVYLYRSWFP